MNNNTQDIERLKPEIKTRQAIIRQKANKIEQGLKKKPAPKS